MAEILWYYAHDQQQMGPVTSAELKRLAAAGEILADDLVWREGMEEWAPAIRVKGLFPPRDAAVSEPVAATAAAPPKAESDVRLAEPQPAAPPVGPPAAGSSAATASVAAPGVVVPPPAVTSASAPPLEHLPQNRLTPGLRTVLILAQGILWATCVMVVILGGLLFMAGTMKKGTSDQAASAAISCTLFVGSYVLARAGEHVALLVEQFLNRHQ